MSAEQFMVKLRNQIEFEEGTIVASEYIYSTGAVQLKLLKQSGKHRRTVIYSQYVADPLDALRQQFTILFNHRNVGTDYTVWPERTIDPDDYWINKLFTIKEVISNAKGTHKILCFTDRVSNQEYTVHARYTKSCKGWLAVDPLLKEFISLQNKLSPVLKLTVTRQDGLFEEPQVDLLTGVIIHKSHFSMQGKTLQISKVVEESADKVVIDCMRLSYPKNSDRDYRHLYTFEVKKGKITKNVESLGFPDWYEQSSPEGHDMVKHPNNTFMHYVLPDSVDPKFEGQHLYILCDNTILVKYGNSWMMVNNAWLRQRISDFPDVQREWLAAEMSGAFN